MSRIKECFTSRWGDDGVIMEADFSQLEVIGLAFLSQDIQLREDIDNGLDMHCLNASFLYGTPYDVIHKAVQDGDAGWTKKRKIAKGPGFLIQYGGGAALMAKNTGLTKEQCQGFIDNYYQRYTGVAAWQETVAEEVQASRRPSARRTESGVPAGVGVYKSITGRRYCFFEYDAPEWSRGRASFSPTQMKNYPVQGFATGDIVPMVLGKLYRVLRNSYLEDTALLINTVHDSILLDVHKDVVEETATVVKTCMEMAPKYFEDTFGVPFDIPLKVDVEVGNSWGSKKKVDIA